MVTPGSFAEPALKYNPIFLTILNTTELTPRKEARCQCTKGRTDNLREYDEVYTSHKKLIKCMYMYEIVR